MNNDLFTLKGKVALVTGCNTGLGQAMAVALAEAGCDIIGFNRREAPETKKLIETHQRTFTQVIIDLGDMNTLKPAINKILNNVQSIDILVNNAGIIRRNDAIEFTEQDWDDVMDVNLKSAFFLSQAIAKHNIEQQKACKIINIASMLSFQGGIRVPSYTASKSGINGLTKLLANEWAKYGINVNAIAPGYMATNNTEALQNDAQRNAEILGRIPAGRWGKPEDLAGACVFLASKASDYVNGTTVAVDGGWLAR